MCLGITSVTMGDEDGATAAGVSVEDKATSTDDERLLSPSPGCSTAAEADLPELELPLDAYSYMVQAAQIWGAGLVGDDRLGNDRLQVISRPHSSRSGRYLVHQESLSSNSSVSHRPKRNREKLKRQRTTESCDADHQRRMGGKTRELKRQWTTESSDSGYTRRYSRECLRRQDTEESAGSTRRLIRDLQRQPTTESATSLHITRQSSIRGGSDNQSLYLPRQSTVETYDDISMTDFSRHDISMTDFSRPESSLCNSGASPYGAASSIHSGDLGAVAMTVGHRHSVAGAAGGGTGIGQGVKERRSQSETGGAGATAANGAQYGNSVQDGCYDFANTNTVSGAPLLNAISRSLIDLDAVDLEASDFTAIQLNLRNLARSDNKKLQKTSDAEALRRAHEKVKKQRKSEDLPKRVRWSIMATGLVLLLMSVILVGATLRMAPLIDEMVRKENEEYLGGRRGSGEADQLNTTSSQVEDTSLFGGTTTIQPGDLASSRIIEFSQGYSLESKDDAQ